MEGSSSPVHQSHFLIHVGERRPSGASRDPEAPPKEDDQQEAAPEGPSGSSSNIFGVFCPVALLSFLLGMFPARWLLPLKCSSNKASGDQKWTSRDWLSPLVPFAVLGQTLFVWHQHWPVLFDLLDEMHWFDYYSAVLSYVVVGASATANYIIMQGRYTRICRILLQLSALDEDSLGVGVNSGMVWVGRGLCGAGVLPLGFVLGRYIFKFKKDFPLKENVGDYAFALCLGYGEMADATLALHLLFMADSLRRRFRLLGRGTTALVSCLEAAQRQHLLAPDTKAPDQHQMQASSEGPVAVLPRFQEEAVVVHERDAADLLFRLRILHKELAEVVESVSSTYGPALLVHIAALMFRLGVSLLVLYWKDHERTTFRIFFAVITFTYFLRLWLMATLSDDIAREARAPADDLLKLRIGQLGPELQGEVVTMMQQMTGPPIRISASNFFQISRSLLTSMSAVLVTYVILIGQWKPGEEIEEDDEGE